MNGIANRLVVKMGPQVSADAYSSQMPMYDRVAIDFDGTINECWSTEDCPDLTQAKPRDGALEGLDRLNKAGIPIVIWTAHEPLDEVKEWLDCYGVVYSDIRHKIPAVAYIDDHAINSKMDWSDLADKAIYSFYGKVRQPVDNWDEIEELQKKAQPEMEKLLSYARPARTVRLDNLPLGELEAQLRQPGSVLVLPPPKSYKRAKEKVEDDYEGNWSKLLDINRAALAFDTKSELDKTANILQEAGEAARPAKDRFAEPLGNGYRDYLVNYRLPCGAICEVQFHLKPMLIARERVKVAYDVARAVHASLDSEGRDDMTPAEAEAIRRARKAAKSMYAQAWQECLANEVKDVARPTNRLKSWKADDVMGLCQCGHDRDDHDGGVRACLVCDCDDYRVVTNGVAEKGIADAGQWLASKWAALEARYGRKTALVMAIGMLGTFVIPGNIPAIIAAAETIRGIRGYFQADFGGSVEKLLQTVKGEIIRYTPALDPRLRNVGQLPAGTGARYLECIRGEGDSLIARTWRRDKPTDFQVLVDFGGNRRQKGETVMDLDPALTLQFPVNRLGNKS